MLENKRVKVLMRLLSLILTFCLTLGALPYVFAFEVNEGNPEQVDEPPEYENSISGRLWLDMQNDNDNGIYPGNGLYEEGEEFLSDYSVSLFKEDDLENEIASVTTDENGYYEFDGLEPGTYVVGVSAESNADVEYLLPGYYLDGVEGENRFVTEYDEEQGEYLGAYTSPIELEEDSSIENIDAGMRTETRWENLRVGSQAYNGDGYGFGTNVANRPLGEFIKATGYAKGENNFETGDWYSGAVYVDGGEGNQCVWFIPNKGSVAKINTKTNIITKYNDFPSDVEHSETYSFVGGVYDGKGKIWMVPYRASHVVSIDISNGNMESYEWPEFEDEENEIKYNKIEHAFQGGILDDEGNVWIIPARENHFIKIDTDSGELTRVGAAWPASFDQDKSVEKINGGTYDGDGSIWMAGPTSVLRYYIGNGTVKEYPYPTGTDGYKPYTGGVYDGNGNVWFMPSDATSLLKMNIASEKLDAFELPDGLNIYDSGSGGESIKTSAFSSGVFDGKYIWMVNFYSAEFVAFDVEKEVMLEPYGQFESEYDLVKMQNNREYKMSLYWGGAFDGQNVWFAPNMYANNILRISPDYSLGVDVSTVDPVFDESVTVEALAKNLGYGDKYTNNHDIVGMEWFRVKTTDITDYSDISNFDQKYMSISDNNDKGSETGPGPTVNEYLFEIDADQNAKYWIKVSYNNSPDDYIIDYKIVDNIYEKAQITYKGVDQEDHDHILYQGRVDGNYGVARELNNDGPILSGAYVKLDGSKEVLPYEEGELTITVVAELYPNWTVVPSGEVEVALDGTLEKEVIFYYTKDGYEIIEKFVDYKGNPIKANEDDVEPIPDEIKYFYHGEEYSGEGTEGAAADADYICIGYMIGEEFKLSEVIYEVTDPTIASVEETHTVWFVYTRASITVEKFKEDGETKLPGTVFKLEMLDENGAAIADKTVLMTTDEDGLCVFDRLPIGNYRIIEESSPDGYSKLIDPIEVSIPTVLTTNEGDYAYQKTVGGTPQYYYYNLKYSVTNQVALTMPEAGSMGLSTIYYILGGAILLTIVAYKEFYLRRRRRSIRAWREEVK